MTSEAIDRGSRLTEYVTTRDGEKLATDVYLPSGPGPFPVLLERTPYGRRGTNHADYSQASPSPISKPKVAEHFAAAGFAYVIQDCRGRFDSSGVFEKYVHESADGLDTLQWVLQQPWCDGHIGTLGFSYGAHVQTALAAFAPKGLDAMFVDSGGFSSAYHNGIRQGGAYELKQLTWAFKHAKLAAAKRLSTADRAALDKIDVRDWMSSVWTSGHSPISAVPEYEAYVVEQWQHDVFDDFWRRPELYAIGHHDAFPEIPMLFVSSWYDPYALTASENYLGLTAAGRQSVRLLLGPWIHGRRSDSHSGAVDFGDAARIDGNLAPDYFAFKRAWFDKNLRRTTTTDYLSSAVTIFVMGGGLGTLDAAGRLQHGGYWLHTDAWPPKDCLRRSLYLGPSESLIFDRVTAADEFVEWTHDSENPVPTIGGPITSGAPVMEGGAFDQCEVPGIFGSDGTGAPLADRPDVMVFQTEPLKQAVEIIGPITATLWVSTSAVDTDFTVKLLDVYPPSSELPDGYAMNLTDGILRLRFRDSFETPKLAESGKRYQIQIVLPPTANRFATGHRIRVDVASSNFPRFDVNPNTGAPAGTPSRAVKAQNRVYWGDHCSSRVEAHFRECP